MLNASQADLHGMGLPLKPSKNPFKARPNSHQATCLIAGYSVKYEPLLESS